MEALKAKNFVKTIEMKTKNEEISDENGQGVSLLRGLDNYNKLTFIQGFKMPSRYKIPYVIYSVLMNFFVSFCFPLAFNLSYFRGADFEISAFATSFQVAFNVHGGPTKTIFLIQKLSQLEKINEIITKLDARCKDPDEIREQLDAIRLGRRAAVLFSASYLAYTFSTFIGGLLNGRPPYSVYMPGIDYRQGTRELLTAAVIEYLLISMAALQHAFDDSYTIIYVGFLRCHIRTLIYRINKLGSNPDTPLNDSVEELKLCIKDYQTLVKFYNLLKPIVSGTMFIQFGLTAAMMSVTLVNITIFSTTLSERFGSVFYMGAVLTQAFPICFFATRFQSDYDSLSMSLFHSPWTKQNVVFRKTMLLFMHHTQQTMIFTAGKIFTIELSTFISIAKFSFSLYTFIKAMDLKAKLGF